MTVDAVNEVYFFKFIFILDNFSIGTYFILNVESRQLNLGMVLIIG